ncbi:MAG: hypothetical protein LBE35_06360, partial [Clostridiales bacterium]|nr:hypothetical protein [Clostridiales bacterium]
MSKIFKRFSSKIKAVIAWVLLLAMVSEAPMALLAAPLDNFNPIIGAQTADEFGFFDDFYDDYYGDYYLEDEDQPEFYEDWYGIDEDERMAAYPGEETANPEETPPVRMTDAEILEFALAPLSATAHEIGNYVQLQAFLDGTLGENHDHFRLTEDINMTGQTPTQGRPGEFTGIFDGGGNTITGLQLRPVAEPGLVGIGFVRQAGHGAVIRNLNFYGASWLDEITGANWINTTTGVGIAVGRTAALPRDGNRQPIATITIDNVRLNGHTLMRQNRATAANVLPNMRIGGLAGDVSLNTVLNIIDIRIQNLDIHSQTGQIRAAGGVVGHVNGGTLNLITRRAGHINAIGVTTRGGGDTNLVNNAHRAGGVLGFLQTGHAFIEDVTITENSSIHAISMAGGIVGGSEHIGSVTIRNAINDATFVSVTARGTAHDGRVGGIFGRARNTVVITNTVNNARVQQHNFENWNSALGGIIGYTGPASFVTIEYTENMGQVLHNAGTNANLGGIIGRSRGRVTINRSSNHGHINKTAGTGANVRVGGIIGLGQLNGFMNITDTYNRGQISTTGDITGGIIGDLWAGGRAVATLRNVRNYNHPDFVGSPGNTITGARQAGGIVGWARSPNMIIDGAFNERPIAVTATGFTTHNPSSAGGIVGRAGGSGLTIRNAENRGDIMPTGTPATRTDGGGIVSHSNAWGLTIENSVNYGHIRANYRVGGILAYAIGNNATLSNVMNHGRVEGTSHANINAGGIVARSERHNLLIRNAGNTGHVSVLSGTNNNAHNGVGGIVGHSRAHNLIIESSFNQGFIEGANATGGIVGRNQAGSLIIRDVYNTGTVHGFVVRSGNGILGRRVSGNVHIARTWVSANVRGYSVATFERSGDLLQRATNHNLSWHMTVGITFDQVYVDLSTVSAASPGDFVDSGLNHHSRCQTRRHDADARQNRSGRIIGVTTELLTSGLLPGINSGVWMTGIHGVETHIQSTFPYFTWQVPTPEGQQQPQQQSSFFNHIRLTGEDFDPDNPEDRRYVLMDLDRQGSTQVTFHGVALHGARVFHPYLPSSAGNFPEIGGGTSNLTPFVRGTAAAALPASIGLISPNHVIAFETGPLPDRFIIRAYDSESGEYIIDHIEFDFGTGFDNFDMFMPGFAPIPLTGDRNPDGIPYAQDNPGMLIIQNALDIPQETRLNFTVNALGYTPSVQNNIQIVSGATHSVAMTREPFEVRVWVRDFLPENENVIDDALGPVVANASLSRIRPPAPDRTNIPPEANHSFDMDDAMIGDNLEARAHLRSHEDRTLATRDLVWRGGNWELDIFAQHIGFGPIRINFVTEELNADGEVITRPVDTRGLSQDRVLIYNFYNNPDPAPLRRANFPLSPWGINMGLDGDISALATFDIITPDDVYPQRWQHQYNLAIADFIEFDELGRPITNEPITIVLHPIQEFDAQVIWTIGGHRLPVTGVDHFWHNPDPTEEVEDGEIPQIGLIPGGINGRFEVPTRPLLNEFRIEAPGFGTTTRIMPRDEVEAQLEIDRESGDSYVELEVFRALPGRQSLDGFVLC